MIADMINNKKLNLIVTELFIRRRKLNTSLVFNTQSCCKFPKHVRLNTTHFFITKLPYKRELREIAIIMIIHQTLVLNISLISIENVLLKHILF